MSYPNLNELNDSSLMSELNKKKRLAECCLDYLIVENDNERVNRFYVKMNRILLDIVELRIEKNNRL